MSEAIPFDEELQVQRMLDNKRLPMWRKYALLATGTQSIRALLKYELIHGLLAGCPGAAGLWLRQKTYRSLLKNLGAGSHIGRNVTFRGVNKIEIGRNVFIDDGCSFDARGPDARIIIHDNAFVSRQTIVRTRGQTLEIGKGTDVGANCIVSTDSNLKIGENVLLAAYTYVCAGGNHVFRDPRVPILRQGMRSKGGVVIGDNVWIGAHSSIFDGVTIGEGTIVGAHSMVNKNLPEMKICFGSPARVVRDRPGLARPGETVPVDADDLDVFMG
jgi:acetyltransferase-like isoleucine patch superfamily enzyme